MLDTSLCRLHPVSPPLLTVYTPPPRMHPLEYDFPFDFDGLDTLEAREEATGMVWSPDVIIKNEVHPLESRTAQVRTVCWSVGGGGGL